MDAFLPKECFFECFFERFLTERLFLEPFLETFLEPFLEPFLDRRFLEAFLILAERLLASLPKKGRRDFSSSDCLAISISKVS